MREAARNLVTMDGVCGTKREKILGQRTRNIVAGQRKRERPKRKWRDSIREGIQGVELNEEDTQDKHLSNLPPFKSKIN